MSVAGQTGPVSGKLAQRGSSRLAPERRVPMDVTIVATMIPIVSLMVGLVIIIVAMAFRSRNDARRHNERMLLAEKGLPIPSELYERAERGDSRPNGYKAGRAWLMVLGCLLFFVGIGVIVYGAAAGEHAENGLVPLFIGLGFLAAERMIARFIARSDRSPDIH
jgi:hypothetical protein